MNGAVVLLWVAAVGSVFGDDDHGDQPKEAGTCKDPKERLTGWQVVVPSDEGYAAAREQYAYTSAPQNIAPSVIVFAAEEGDVVNAVRFARECRYKVVARSGGHQYDGLSSCNGATTPCVQVDVSQLNQTTVDGTTVTVGAGARLADLYRTLQAHGVFVGGGECAYVGVGGHMQTGGYGFLGRSFGLLGDYVTGFDIVLSKGQKVTVRRPDGKQSRVLDRLFWAVMGGGAGSWGVITRVYFEARRDADYEHSTLFTCSVPYTKDTLRTILSAWTDLTYSDGWQAQTEETVWLATLGQAPLGPNVIQIRGLWQGSVPFDPTTYNMFVGLVEGTGASCRAIPMPLSAIVTAVMLPTPREAPFPFVRRSAAVKGAFGGSIDVEAYLSAVDEMVSDATNGIFAVSQIAAVGGKILTNDPNSETTSYPLRDASYIMGLNLFYANVINPGAEVRARQHQETRWPSVVVSPHDWRFIWSTWGNVKIEEVWQHYYDNHDTFDTLRRAKTAFDPTDMFSTPFTVPPLSRKL